MEILLVIIIGLLWIGLITPPPNNNNDKPIKYWNNGR